MYDKVYITHIEKQVYSQKLKSPSLKQLHFLFVDPQWLLAKYLVLLALLYFSLLYVKFAILQCSSMFITKFLTFSTGKNNNIRNWTVFDIRCTHVCRIKLPQEGPYPWSGTRPRTHCSQRIPRRSGRGSPLQIGSRSRPLSRRSWGV